MAGHKGKKRRGHDDHDDHPDERWLLTYSDMITLLMALFIVMWSMSVVNSGKFDALALSLHEAFSGKILPGGESIQQQGASTPPNKPAPEQPIPSIKPVTDAGKGDGTRSDAATKEAEDLEKLKREIDQWTREHGLADQVETEVAHRGLVVRVLTDKVLFDSGQAEIKPAAVPLLDALSRLLKTAVRNPIQVEGNTDDVPVSGRFPTNWELSTTRATAVVRDLIARGVWPGRLAATGYADRHPIATNATEFGRRRNRRVELVVLRTGQAMEAADTSHGGTTK